MKPMDQSHFIFIIILGEGGKAAFAADEVIGTNIKREVQASQVLKPAVTKLALIG